MRESPPRLCPVRLRPLRLRLLGLAGAAALALATLPALAAAEPSEPDALEAWKGRSCASLRCHRPPANPVSAVAGFGLAAVGAALLARRWPQHPADRERQPGKQ